MSDLILHHYAGSPFSEKMRLIFGFKGLSWHSVNVPVIMPKPDVVALTGGYRRTPFLQIGADIYCDTPHRAGIPPPPVVPCICWRNGLTPICFGWRSRTPCSRPALP